MAVRDLKVKRESSAGRLLAEKITTPAHPERHVSRERLRAGLRESLACCAATVISGRAGTGKSALAADFARAAGRAVAWYKVEAADAELPVFFKYLCASVARCRPSFGARNLLTLNEAWQAANVPLLVECFVSELLCVDEPLLVVIDDLHFVYDEEWMAPFFQRLLPLLPREAHLVLLGRGLPPAPLWRMRSKQTLSVIEEPALAFTLREARELFNLYGAPEGEAAAAWEETHGRASALARKAASLAARDGASNPSERGRKKPRPPRPVLIKGFTIM